MTLFVLPSELTLNITEYLDPDSCVNFALTCKDHATLCKFVLRGHGKLLSEWQTIDTSGAQILLWQTLKEVLDDPRKGWYVRELNLPPSRQYNWSPEAGLLHAGPAPSAEELKLFKAAAQPLEELYPSIPSGHVLARDPHLYSSSFRRPNNLIGTIEDRIDNGMEDGILAILLHHLPNLKTIRLTQVDDTSDCFELVMHRIAGGYKDTKMASKLPLRRLTTAAVSYCNTEGCISPDWACSFLGLPFLRTFAAFEMGGRPSRAMQECYLQPGAAPFSNVTELLFKSCLFDVEGLEIMLAGIKNLKKFTYDGGGVDVSYSFYEPRKVLQTLVTHAGNCLEELVLEQDQPEEDVRTCSELIA
jgi:hypothetical protein